MIEFLFAQVTTSYLCFADMGEGVIDLSSMCGQSQPAIVEDVAVEVSAPTVSLGRSVYLPGIDPIEDCVNGQINRRLRDNRRNIFLGTREEVEEYCVGQHVDVASGNAGTIDGDRVELLKIDTDWYYRKAEDPLWAYGPYDARGEAVSALAAIAD